MKLGKISATARSLLLEDIAAAQKPVSVGDVNG
jgi:hypothetical protein